jgi:hypothetical protein
VLERAPVPQLGGDLGLDIGRQQSANRRKNDRFLKCQVLSKLSLEITRCGGEGLPQSFVVGRLADGSHRTDKGREGQLMSGVLVRHGRQCAIDVGSAAAQARQDALLLVGNVKWQRLGDVAFDLAADLDNLVMGRRELLSDLARRANKAADALVTGQQQVDQIGRSLAATG